MVLELGYLTSLVEGNKATKQEEVMKTVLNPITKLFLAKESLKVISEGLENFGGVGYDEQSGLPALLRNAQVLTIWEGTTHHLCWEFGRRLQHYGDAGAEAIAGWIRNTIDMAYSHPSEIVWERRQTFAPFKSTVLLYNAVMPILRAYSNSKGNRLSSSYGSKSSLLAERDSLRICQPCSGSSLAKALHIYRVRRQLFDFHWLG